MSVGSDEGYRSAACGWLGLDNRRSERLTITRGSIARSYMMDGSPDADMETGVHRTLEFATMRDNITACIDLLDTQTFGRRAD